MNKKILSLFLLAGSLLFVACDKDDDNNTPTTDPNKTNFTAAVNANAEVPTNPSTASGTFTGTLDKTTRVLTYKVEYTGLAPLMGHLHRGAPGVNGPVVVPFDTVAVKKSPINGTATLRQGLVDSLTNGMMYVNLHTKAYPGGEIRGNISAVK